MGKDKDSSSVRRTSDAHYAVSDKRNKTGSIKSADEDLIPEADEPFEAQQLENELSKITVSSPVISESSIAFESENFPESYRQNNKKEKRILAYAENFRKQYVHLYRDRKPLFLNPPNELQVEKFVCSTIRPSELPYKEVYEWQGASDFISDFLNFVPLNPAHELPTRLLSPNTVVKLQRGTCFEYSTLLVSMLIGVGYDAYVVSGYATKETCLVDETREICPLMKVVAEVAKEEVDQPVNKYAVRQPKDLRSKFDMKQEAKRLKQYADEDERLRKQEQARLSSMDLPPEDELFGLRVHSWVLVLQGKREVPEPFFIEPLTGQPHPTDSSKYLGVESVWNHRNYWVNMQDCSEGVSKLRYDLEDTALWEYMLPSNDKVPLSTTTDDDDEAEHEREDEIEKHLDIPPSWTQPIKISARDFQMRCPQGRKVKLYKRAKLEKIAPYVLSDGLVCRLSIYEDIAMEKLVEMKEMYKNRMDKLLERHYDYTAQWITEKFGTGCFKNISEHKYKISAGLRPEGERTMTFFHDARVDGLEKRAETPTEMIEYFRNRDDFLVYRHVEYGPRQKKFGPAEDVTLRPIEKLTEHYNRNVAKDANDDIAQVTFNINEAKVDVVYHREDSKISATTREFVKPSANDDKGAGGIMWNVENHTCYLSDTSRKQKKNAEIYQLMMDLLKMEQRCVETVRQSEREVCEILDGRIKQEVTAELAISIYDTIRNDKAKIFREKLEKLELEAKLNSDERELDYLEPFLAQLNRDEMRGGKLTRQQVLKLKDDCLSSLKQQLIDKANLIQSRFEKETRELKKKQAWYQQNQVTMLKADEQQYLSYCNETLFRIHILELRLNRHKELAPRIYHSLEQKIRSDPRLMEFF